MMLRIAIGLFLLMGFSAYGSEDLYLSHKICVADLHDDWSQWTYVAKEGVSDPIYEKVTGSTEEDSDALGFSAWLENSEVTKEARQGRNSQLKMVKVTKDPSGDLEVRAWFGSKDPKWAPLFYGRVRKSGGRGYFWVKDIDFGFYLSAKFELGSRQIYFSTELVSQKKGGRSGSLSGTRLFDAMIEHFEDSEPSSILGMWSEGTNFDQYTQARLKLGLSPEEAAARTWTGRNAIRHGYSLVRVTREKQGRWGKILEVDAEFSRP